ncbi:hypothetical protein JCGZ_22752 [Jatropha curcas]|uniref:Uncharacterized protein n=1 Tax=Jatropha curcas TaxID=180498 RepID=A0A067LFD5_JATCU|nr:hypothetical protein JCGZ_22752 [Jatropha curcas]
MLRVPKWKAVALSRPNRLLRSAELQVNETRLQAVVVDGGDRGERQLNCDHRQGATDLIEEKEDRWWCDRGSLSLFLAAGDALERLDHLRSTQEGLSYSSGATGGAGGCATRLSSMALVSFDRRQGSCVAPRDLTEGAGGAAATWSGWRWRMEESDRAGGGAPLCYSVSPKTQMQ